jgi:hypothetical protein
VQAHVGDTIEVLGNRVGDPVRRGKVTEVVAEDPRELRVEWDDGHESVFTPAAGMTRVVEPKG